MNIIRSGLYRFFFCCYGDGEDTRIIYISDVIWEEIPHCVRNDIALLSSVILRSETTKNLFKMTHLSKKTGFPCVQYPPLQIIHF